MPNIYFEELFSELGCPKPTPAVNAIPKWFKEMDRFYGKDDRASIHARENGTIRDCPAVNDALFSGYTLYLPADIFIDATGTEIEYDIGHFGKGSRIEDANFNFIAMHSKSSTKGYNTLFDVHEQTMKWQTYWGVRTDEGYSTLFIHPIHRTDLPFHMVTAIVDTDKFGTREPYGFFIKKGFKGIIHRGTPMLQVFPFKREEWKMEIVEPDGKDYIRNKQMISSVFNQPYKKLFWQRKKYS
jgi:hypothetical protein